MRSRTLLSLIGIAVFATLTISVKLTAQDATAPAKKAADSGGARTATRCRQANRAQGVTGRRCELSASERSRDVVVLDSCLNELEKLDPRKCKAIELRYFAGLSMDEITQTLDVSHVTIRRDVRMAEAWLYHEMQSV